MSVLPAYTCTTNKPMDGSEAPNECWELSSVHSASALSLRDISPAPGAFPDLAVPILGGAFCK